MPKLLSELSIPDSIKLKLPDLFFNLFAPDSALFKPPILLSDNFYS